MFRTKFKNPTIGLVISSLLMLLMALSIASPALAAGGGPLEGDISGGSLTVANVSGATLTQSLSLDGKNDSLTIKVPLAVTDARGTGAGWAAYVDAGQFSTEDSSNYTLSQAMTVSVKDSGAAPVGITLPNSTTNLGCDALSTCSLPDTLVGNGTTVPVEPASWSTDHTVYDASGYNGLALFTASSSNGMGTMYLEADFSLTIPANVVVLHGGTTNYKTTIAITFTDTPV